MARMVAGWQTDRVLRGGFPWGDLGGGSCGAAQVKLFDSGLTRTLLDWSPDGKEIAFVRGAGNELGIDALEVKSGTVRRVLGSELGPGEPRWAPDGKKLLFSTHSPPGIAILNVSESE